MRKEHANAQFVGYRTSSTIARPDSKWFPVTFWPAVLVYFGRRGRANLLQKSLARVPEGLDRRAARAGRIAVGHHVNWNRGLFLALTRHAGARLGDKPALKLDAGFESSAPDN